MQIVFTAAELKLAAMPQYQLFLGAMKQLEERLRDDLAASDSNVIFTQQGKAQLMTQLLKKLEDPIKSREELKRRS